jgi:hypothetical protein
VVKEIIGMYVFMKDPRKVNNERKESGERCLNLLLLTLIIVLIYSFPQLENLQNSSRKAAIFYNLRYWDFIFTSWSLESILLSISSY